MRRRARSTEAVEFFNILTSPAFLETTEALLPEHRERPYPPTVTQSMFMRQTLESDGSCQKAVNSWAAQRAADGLCACSVRTGAYCRARQRLPLSMVTALTRQTGRMLSGQALARWRWRGRAMIRARELSKVQLSALRARRWNVELDLRNLKTTTGMEALSRQAPQMNEMQLWAHLLAYNVIRLLMAQAACGAGVEPRGLSFRHTVQLWTEWVARGLPATQCSRRLFALIAHSKVGHRPGRVEPRMRKRRPKPYPLLKVSRAQARRQRNLRGWRHAR
jgi:hypothetical protein